jgi:hypothetical protein
MVALPFRQIHLDFHTSPLIPDVAAEFDPDEFARTLKDAFVNSVTVFAKCHHGMSYYDTKVGIKHPALKRDLLGEMIAACHRYGIRTPVYISVVWDNWAAEHHPEWRQVNREGKFVGAEPFQAGWRWLCLNTGYADYVAAQTEEVVKGYEVDGVFFDIVMQWECYCEKCRRDMLAQGLDPENAEHARQFARQVCQRFMGRVNEIVHRHRPNATVYHNSRLRIGTSREAHLYTHQEIESLPTGGWGYLHFPFFARYVRTVWREFLGMTARFHRSWADFGTLKTEAALAYECFHALALGGKCSIGDQLHPRGKLDKTVYERIGAVYRRIAELEEWCEGAEGVAEIAILTNADAEDGRMTESDEGATRMLMETHWQFDVIDRFGDFNRYQALIVPDRFSPDPQTLRKLRAFLQRGGKVLLSARAFVDAQGKFALADLAGFDLKGEASWDCEYLLVGKAISDGVPEMPHVVNAPSMIVEAKNAKTLATVGEPYFNRTWRHFTSHRHSPMAKATRRPAIVQSANGQIVYFAHPLFRLYAQHGYLVYRQLVVNALRMLMPERLMETDAPSFAHVTLTRQNGRNRKGRVMAHLLSYTPIRRTRTIDIVEEPIVLRQVTLQVRTGKKPQQVYLAPQRTELPFEFADGVVRFIVPEVNGYQVVVMEL